MIVLLFAKQLITKLNDDAALLWYLAGLELLIVDAPALGLLARLAIWQLLS